MQVRMRAISVPGQMVGTPRLGARLCSVLARLGSFCQAVLHPALPARYVLPAIFALGMIGFAMQQAHASSAPVLRLGCDPQVDAALCNAMQQQLESHVAGRFNVLQVRYGDETPTAPAEMGLALRIDRQGEGWVAAHLEWQAGRDGHSGRGPSVELSVMDAPLSPTMYARLATDLLRVDPAMAAVLDPDMPCDDQG